MNRRELLTKIAPLVGIALPASKLIPESFLHEIKPEKKYLLHIPHIVHPDMLGHARRHLELSGMKNVTLLAGEFDIFDVSE